MISFTIPEDSTLQDIYKKLREKGFENIKAKKLKFSADEGGYGIAIKVTYSGESDYDDSEII